MRKLKLIILAVLVLVLAALASAQTIPATSQQQVFNNRTTNGCSAPVRNINQASHTVLFYTNGSATGTIYMQGSNDNSHYAPMSNVGDLSLSTSPVLNIIQGGGYFAEVEICITGLNAAGVVSAWYSSSTGTTPYPSNTGYVTTDQPITFVPVLNAYMVALPAVVSAGQSLCTGCVIYGVTASNPTSSAVYVRLGGTSSLYTSGAGILETLVPANGSVNFPVPVTGIWASAFYVGCSTSATSAADPGTPCVISAVWKIVVTGTVPN